MEGAPMPTAHVPRPFLSSPMPSVPMLPRFLVRPQLLTSADPPTRMDIPGVAPPIANVRVPIWGATGRPSVLSLGNPGAPCRGAAAPRGTGYVHLPLYRERRETRMIPQTPQ